MYPKPRKTNITFSFSLDEIESLDLSHSLGITRETGKLEKGHCRKGRKILGKILWFILISTGHKLESLGREPLLKKCLDCLEDAGRPTQVQRSRQGWSLALSGLAFPLNCRFIYPVTATWFHHWHQNTHFQESITVSGSLTLQETSRFSEPDCNFLGTHPCRLSNCVIVWLPSERQPRWCYSNCWGTSPLECSKQQFLNFIAWIQLLIKLQSPPTQWCISSNEVTPISTWPHCLIMPFPMGQAFNHTIPRRLYLFKPPYSTSWPPYTCSHNTMQNAFPPISEVSIVYHSINNVSLVMEGDSSTPSILVSKARATWPNLSSSATTCGWT